jgi:energy-coupling factor transporter ATP-binding protein EcfA2
MGICSRPNCGKLISHIGVCGPCYEADRLKKHWSSMGKAINSVPEHYRGNEWGTEELHRRCPSLARLENDSEVALTPATLMSSKMIVLYGESGAGKTSLATALFHWIIDSTTPDSTESIVTRAQGARFVDACDLSPNQAHEGIPVAVVARRTPILLLDDAGAEGGTGDSYKAKDRYLETAELLRYRDKRDLTTIVTTPGIYGPDAENDLARRWTEMYGGGIMRRYLEGADVKIVYLKKKQRLDEEDREADRAEKRR